MPAAIYIQNLTIEEARKIRAMITILAPTAQHKAGMNGFIERQAQKQETMKAHIQDMQRAIDFTMTPLVEEKPLHTYYCLFLPLGIYCGFGAENIHHAYNKAAKHWGAKNQIGRPYDDMPESKIQRDCRIYVFDDIKHVELTRKQVSHTLMTKLVKAWREENN